MPLMVCRVCGTSLGTVDDVLHHAETAHPTRGPDGPGDLLCPGCPMTFRQLVQLKRHVAQAHAM